MTDRFIRLSRIYFNISFVILLFQYHEITQGRRQKQHNTFHKTLSIRNNYARRSIELAEYNSLEMIFTSFDSRQIGNSDVGIIERKPPSLDWPPSDGTSVHIN